MIRTPGERLKLGVERLRTLFYIRPSAHLRTRGGVLIAPRVRKHTPSTASPALAIAETTGLAL